MKFSIYIDYASLFISTKNIYKFKSCDEIENYIYKAVTAIEEFIKIYFKNTQIQILEKKAFILPDKAFGFPEDTLGRRGINCIRVDDELKKSFYKKKLNLSRKDDPELIREAAKDILEKKLSGIIVISNDYDFKSLAKMTTNHGIYFCCAVNEGKGVTINRDFKKQCDIYIRIAEILKNNKLEIEDITKHDSTELVSGRRIEIYKDKKLIKNYPVVSGKQMTIGRCSISRGIYPSIDLDAFDEEKIISREHGIIDVRGNEVMYVVHENCSRGTWYNLKAKKKGDRFLLSPNVPMVLGSSKGFVLFYRDR
ncbi:FHA domain-containing protein [Clostridium sp. D43t1_170807_H7]|uniref:FHA domain-containing protein n=1 Tax=Clostridium sp. D43t1_170807_H7 TaxID=2787140 RepID=UPI001896BC6E|nr:FHA domain-containing protein [Clostridium sp. D43t1_170807_H7]